jgi:alpha-glucosidase
MASMNLLGSHDTARMRNVVGGDRELHIAAMALLLTYPGVPTIFAGDEIGLEGAWGEDARRTMPWSKTESWDNEFLEATKRLIAIRKESEALMIGGLRFLEVADDHFLFARELVDSSYVILISRVPLETFTSPTEFGFNDGEVLFASTCVRIWSCR